MAMTKAPALREMTREELKHMQRDLTDELFNLRMRRSLKGLDNPLRLRIIGREIARINTVLREDETGLRKIGQANSAPTPAPAKRKKA